MILILLIIFVFVFSWSMIFLPHGVPRTSWNSLSFVIIAGALMMIVLNNNYHWGMQQVTTTQSAKLLPLKSPKAALGVKQLGTGSEQIIVYRTMTKPSKLQHTSATTTTTIQLKSGIQANVKIESTRWRYKNQLAKTFFSLGQPDGALVKRHYTFTSPRAWHTILIPAKAK
ncbi:DUF4811 domain-containing protein [Lactiplantibacillus dongliensis]|uniref:DUF4811 domain-containing protein n=1 Tax=Lactiplantibacillus dongliensis TaxID=2559919 RepID=A0ABW1R1H4_9LACO|nr:DUF4811 domain-containing protein [Lactiplantibacillus dongliensis]